MQILQPGWRQPGCRQPRVSAASTASPAVTAQPGRPRLHQAQPNRPNNLKNTITIPSRRPRAPIPTDECGALTALPGRLPCPAGIPRRRLGHVGHDPRRSGLVCHEPQTAAAAGAPAATRHSGNVASITRRRTQMTRPLGDSAKIALSSTVQHSSVGRRPAAMHAALCARAERPTTAATSIAVWDATIWRRDPGGTWRIAVDISTPLPRPDDQVAEDRGEVHRPGPRHPSPRSPWWVKDR